MLSPSSSPSTTSAPFYNDAYIPLTRDVAESVAARLGGDFAEDCALFQYDEAWFGEILAADESGRIYLCKIGAFSYRPLSTVENTSAQSSLRENAAPIPALTSSISVAALAKRLSPRRVVDWRHLIAQAYYQRSLGQYFDFDGVTVRLLCRSTVYAEKRSVYHIHMQGLDASGNLLEYTLCRDDWGRLTHADTLRPRTEAASGLPDIRALLTPEQYQLVAASRQKPLIIQGVAGSGKTTIALARIAWLMQGYAGDFGRAPVAGLHPARTLMVMFNKALSTFVKRNISALGLDAMPIDTFHGWALGQLRRVCKTPIEPHAALREPAREEAAALKRRAEMLRVIDQYVAQQEREIDAWLVKHILVDEKGMFWLMNFRTMPEPLAARLDLLQKEAKRLWEQASVFEKDRYEDFYIFFKRAYEHVTDYVGDLHQLMGDEDLLRKHFTDLDHETWQRIYDLQQKIQIPAHTQSHAQSHAQHDAVQQNTAKNPYPQKHGNKVMFEDFAVLLRLIQQKHGSLDGMVYEHIVIDEAQDFGPVELTVLLSSVNNRSNVTIVGDINQKIIPSSHFIGWPAIASFLGANTNTNTNTSTNNINSINNVNNVNNVNSVNDRNNTAICQLRATHRSTAPIVRAAACLLQQAHIDVPEVEKYADSLFTGRAGPLPTLQRVSSFELQLEVLISEVRRAFAAFEQQHFCIVVRKQAASLPLFDHLQKLWHDAGLTHISLRHGYNNTFVFAAGVTVTHMAQIKGLEFDTVAVLDPSDLHYPADRQGVRFLYTVVTRAREKLLFIDNTSNTPPHAPHETPTGAQAGAQAGTQTGARLGTLMRALVQAGLVLADPTSPADLPVS